MVITTSGPRLRRRRAALVAGAVAATLLLVPGAHATTDLEQLTEADTVRVGGVDLPIHERFVYHENNDDRRPAVGGFVHGVRRVEGGTVLYYSIGQAAGTGDQYRGGGFDTVTGVYRRATAVDMRLLDTVDLVAYQPMATESETFAVRTADLASQPGQLRVGMSVFPPLPEDLETVSVIMGYGMAVGDVPIEDGPLEPVGDEAAPLLGEGWPAIPAPSLLAEADATQFMTSLTRRTTDLESATQTAESTEAVTLTLDANVLFAFDSADLSEAARATLADVAADIRERGEGEVVVTGYTDSQGSSSYNQALSEDRAAAVVAELEGASGDAVTFSAVGRGSRDPVADNQTEEGRQLNRRVTVTYQIEEQS